MSDEGTPVGEQPASGGRPRIYRSDAERSRAWRTRQRQKVANGGDVGPPAPSLAEPALSVALEQLRELMTSHEAAIGAERARVEAAIGSLADPEAVAQELAAGRAETTRLIAEASEQVARANQLRITAETQAREAQAARDEAEAAANGAWERVEALEAASAEQLNELQRVGREAEEAKASYEVAFGELKESHVRRLEEVRTGADALVQEARRSQAASDAIADELRAVLDAERVQHLDELARLRTEHAAALTSTRQEVVERLGATHRAELERYQAQADAEIAKASSRAHAAGELSDARAAEVARLAAQVQDLRDELARSRTELARLLQARQDDPTPPAGERPAGASGRRRRQRPPG